MSTDNTILRDEFISQILSPGMIKNAEDAMTAFTRWRVREESFYREILPPFQVTNQDLVPQVDTDMPAMVFEMEPESPAAISIPFATLPITTYIRGPRYRVHFSRIASPAFIKDIDELRTWRMDIRQVLSNNAAKAILAEEDCRFITAVNSALVAADTEVPMLGTVMWQTVSGGIARDSVQEAFKIMPRSPCHFEVNTVLVNNVTVRDILKWGRDEVGGDLSQTWLQKGFGEVDFMNARWLVTIKRDLVPDGTMFFFGDPRCLGKALILEDVTMYVKREAMMLEFFSYETIGGAIANPGACARADFE